MLLSRRTIDVLYVVGSGSRHGNLELLWSLRSLERHARDSFGSVNVDAKIVGFVPDWFRGSSLEMDDPTDSKERNMAAKIVAACRSGLVSGEFLVSADDHFLAADVDFFEMPQFFRHASLPKYDANARLFDRTLGSARDELVSRKLNKYHMSQHFNMFMHSDDADALDDLSEASHRRHPDVYANAFSVAGNLWVDRNIRSSGPRAFVHRKDLKLGENAVERLETGVVGSRFGFSISDKAFNNPLFIPYMLNMYPDPSRWEDLKS